MHHEVFSTVERLPCIDFDEHMLVTAFPEKLDLRVEKTRGLQKIIMNVANCCDIGVRESIDGKFSFFLTTSDSCFEGKIYMKMFHSNIIAIWNKCGHENER